MPSDASRAQWSLRQVCEALRSNARAVPFSMAILLCALAVGFYQHLPWARTRWEDSLPLVALLLLSTCDQLQKPLVSTPGQAARLFSWGGLLLGALLLCVEGIEGIKNMPAEHDFEGMLWQNIALFCLCLSLVLRRDGFPVAARLAPLFLQALLLLPLYEFLLLEVSYPLRLISTAISAWVLRLFTFGGSHDGTTLIWGGTTLSITDACSGIALVGMLCLVEYLVARTIRAAAWKKWCWGSLLLLWLLLGNACRLLLTAMLHAWIGERVFLRGPHYLLGCFFVVVTALLIWGSSCVFALDTDEETSR